MKKSLLCAISALLMSGIAFAQQDIGELLFKDILKMSQYPGAPFTGNIVNDLVMFFFIPTVFIILIIYTLAGRMTDNAKIDLLLSVTFYIFIVFGGYFGMFALLAGPYFLFMLIFMGLFMFFLGHFGLRRAGGGRAPSLPSGGGNRYAHFETLSRQDLKVEQDRVKNDIKAIERELHDAGKMGGDPQRLGELRVRKATLEGELREIETQLNVIKRWTRKIG